MDRLLDLVPIWTAIIALGVFLYVLLDGFDLGVGILYGLAPKEHRRLVMNSIAPVWDGNETWLILGGVALLAVFPLAFAIIIPAVYFPVLLMLLALVFRGVAFEFRFKRPWIDGFWTGGFCFGSALAAFAQGAVLGAFIQGFAVEGRDFAGSSWDWLTPFSVLTGVALMLGYGLLGAGWLIIKTEGDLQAWARRAGRVCFLGVLLAILARQHLDTDQGSGHRPALVLLAELPVPGACADPDGADRPGRMAGPRRPGRRRRPLPRRHGPFPPLLSRHRDQPLADDRAPALHPLAGGLVAQHPGLSPDRHPFPRSRDPHVHGLVVLGLPGQDAGRYRLPLRPRCRPHLSSRDAVDGPPGPSPAGRLQRLTDPHKEIYICRTSSGRTSMAAADISLDPMLAALRAAAELSRLRLLAICAQGEWTVSELTQIMGQSQPRISRHLKLLAEAGLLERFREGSWVFYRRTQAGEGARLARALCRLLPEGDARLLLDRQRLEAVREARRAQAERYFDGRARGWDSERDLAVDGAEVEEALVDLFEGRRVPSLIDIGTGTGRILQVLAQHVGQGLGIDRSHDMLAVARANLDRREAGNCQVRHGDMYRLPLPDASFAAAILHQVLHFADDPLAALAEARRVLRPGGWLVVVDLAHHGEEWLRSEKRHRRLGFTDREMAGWFGELGLAAETPLRLPGPTLTVAIWRGSVPDAAERNTDQDRRQAA